MKTFLEFLNEDLNRIDDATVKKILKTPRKIVRKYDVPYVAGSSNNNKITYIDRRVPKKITIGSKTFDPAYFLNIHEHLEHHLMVLYKMKYLDAHRNATIHEMRAVKKAGIDWRLYKDLWDRMDKQIEKEKCSYPPPDLYTKPYPNSEVRKIDSGEKKEPGYKPEKIGM